MELLVRIDSDLHVTMDKNPETKQRWYPLGICFGYDAVIDPSHAFVSS